MNTKNEYNPRFKIFKIIALSFLSFISLLVLALVIWFFTFTNQPPPFLIETIIPKEVALGDTATLSFQVQNRGNESKTLESIDIYNSFINNMNIVGQSNNIKSIRKSSNFYEFNISETIAPNQNIDIHINIVGLQVGSFTGDVMLLTPENEITHTAVGISVK
ncbi:MAG: hypothetical protein OCC49_10215 [Fibrobacterales bacterium]